MLFNYYFVGDLFKMKVILHLIIAVIVFSLQLIFNEINAFLHQFSQNMFVRLYTNWFENQRRNKHSAVFY